MTTTVVNIRKEPYDIYIGRAGRGMDGFFGNPFVLSPTEDRGATLTRYKRWLWDNPDVLERLPQLRDKRIGCFCKPHPCHGDVIKACLDTLSDAQILTRVKELRA